jgi:hypothetical protein
MIERLLILLLFTAAGAAAYALLRLWQRRRVQKLASDALALPPDVDARLAPGQAAVLAFSTRSCAECRTRQAPALARLRSAVGDSVAVVSLDALDHPDLVAQLGILTVPSTVVLSESRQVRHLNLGYASDARLAEQLAGV